MTPNQAREILQTYPEKLKVQEQYDEDPLFAEALRALIPDFEYPDYAYKMVGRVLQESRAAK